MTNAYMTEKKNKVRQLREKARYDKDTVHAVLDAGLAAAVGFVQDGAPVVVPMIYGRDGETIFLHGARKARVVRLLEQTDQACRQRVFADYAQRVQLVRFALDECRFAEHGRRAVIERRVERGAREHEAAT